MKDPVIKLQILTRAELALAKIRIQRVIRRSALFVVATVFALLGLGMFNFAGFNALSSTKGPAMAALIIALIDSGIMVILLLVALKTTTHENEEKLAQEIRDLANTELNRDIEEVKGEIIRVVDDLSNIRSSIVAVRKGAESTFLPLLKLIMKAVKK